MVRFVLSKYNFGRINRDLFVLNSYFLFSTGILVLKIKLLKSECQHLDKTIQNSSFRYKLYYI